MSELSEDIEAPRCRDCEDYHYGPCPTGAVMTKQKADVLEFLRSFIAGGVNQDFKPWARELYEKLYRDADEPTAEQCGYCGLTPEELATKGDCPLKFNLPILCHK